VDSVGPAGNGQLRIVVDHERNPIGIAEPSEGLSGPVGHPTVTAFLPKLDDVNTAVESGLEQGFGVLIAGMRIADEVKARRAQAFASQCPYTFCC
jgi:hypothetical protein